MKERIIKLGNLEVNYKEWEGGEKGVFLILHGWGGSSNSWVDVASMLAVDGYRVIVPDMPGFGKTQIDKVYDVDDYSEFVEKIVDKMGLEEFILLGHSNGGRISISLSVRGNLKIKTLILNNSAGIKNPLTLKQKIYKFVAKTLKIFKFVPGYKTLRKIYYKAIGGYDYLNIDGNEYKKATFLNMINSDLKDEIPKVKEDSLIIWGELDTYTPLRNGREISTLIKGSKFVLLEGETHGIHLKNPKRLFDTIIKNI